MIINDEQINKLIAVANMYLLDLDLKNARSRNPYALAISNLLKDIQNQQSTELKTME
jgi:hypothetical protein